VIICRMDHPIIKDFDAFLFDLDGTIVDEFNPKKGIEPTINAVCALLGRLKYKYRADLFLKGLKKLGKKTALVTTASDWQVEFFKKSKVMNEVAPFNEVFDLVVTGSDVKNHKPSPDAYELAIDKLKLDPKKSLAFEDSFDGVQAGYYAGLNVCAVQNPYTVDEFPGMAYLAKHQIGSYIPLFRQVEQAENDIVAK